MKSENSDVDHIWWVEGLVSLNIMKEAFTQLLEITNENLSQ